MNTRITRTTFVSQCLESDFNIEFEDDEEVTLISQLIQDAYRKCADGDMKGLGDLLASLDKHPAMQKSERAGDWADD